MTYFSFGRVPKKTYENFLAVSIVRMIVSNLRMLLTKVVSRFWVYFFAKMLILALCSFLPIRSHIISICTFLFNRFIPQATREPLLEVSSYATLEIAPRFKLLTKHVRNSGSVSGFAVTRLGFYFLYLGRLDTVTELKGFHKNAKHVTVEW